MSDPRNHLVDWLYPLGFLGGMMGLMVACGSFAPTPETPTLSPTSRPLLPPAPDEFASPTAPPQQPASVPSLGSPTAPTPIPSTPIPSTPIPSTPISPTPLPRASSSPNSPTPLSSLSPLICADPVSQAQLNQCARQTLEASERLQEQVIQQIQKQLQKQPAQAATASPTTSVALLDQAQSSWDAYRQAACEYLNRDRAQQPTYETFVTTCLTALTETRTGQLRRWVRPTAGDSITPSPQTAEMLAAVHRLGVLYYQGQPLHCERVDGPILGAPPQRDLLFRCTQVVYEQVDAALQQRYDAIAITLLPVEQPLLRQMQQTWTRFRDHHCQWVTGEDPSTWNYCRQGLMVQHQTTLEGRSPQSKD